MKSGFNTSHVTLYLSVINILYSIFHRFNTSHVTLYPKIRSDRKIHPTFQYITCYSLSLHPWTYHSFLLVSIHHMLLFISVNHSEQNCSDWVSIHHMLLFIPRFIGILSIHMSNNTPKPKEFQYFYQALLEILYF